MHFLCISNSHIFPIPTKTRLEVPSSSQVPKSADERENIEEKMTELGQSQAPLQIIYGSGRAAGNPFLSLGFFFLEPPALLRSPKVVPAAATPTEWPVAAATTPTPKGVIPHKRPVHAPKEPPRPIVGVVAPRSPE